MQGFKNFLENNQNWLPGSPLKDKSGNPILVYHGTGKNFKKFNLNKTTQNIIWFTNDKSKIENREAGAESSGYIISAHVDLNNPAGWKEYGNLLLFQLKSRGHDGVILEDPDGTFDLFVFDPSQIHIVKKEKLLT
jgi:hypothetical protein